jgi:hypothetical protein
MLVAGRWMEDDTVDAVDGREGRKGHALLRLPGGTTLHRTRRPIQGKFNSLQFHFSRPPKDNADPRPQMARSYIISPPPAWMERHDPLVLE